MSYVPYVSNVDSWKRLSRAKFINAADKIQTGQGSSVQVISPQQGVIERVRNIMKSRIKKGKSNNSMQSTSRSRKKKTSPNTTSKRRKGRPIKKKSKSKSKTKTKSNKVKRLKSRK